MADYSQAKQEYDRLNRAEQRMAFSVVPMPDPYEEGRRIRRERIFARAAELRYNRIKFPEQRDWADLTDKDRGLWIDVQKESYAALLVAMGQERYSLLDFVLEGE